MIDYKKQSLYNTVGSIIYLFSLWLLTVITTKITGYYDAGILALAIAIGNLIYSFQIYGGRGFQVSDIENSHSINGYFTARLITVSIGLSVCIIVLFFLKYDIKTATVVFGYTLFRSFDAVSESLFADLVKRGRLDVFCKSLIIKGFLTVLTFTIVLKATKLIAAAMISIVIVSGCITVLYDINHYKTINYSFHVVMKGAEAKTILISSFLLMFSALLPTFVNSYPRVVLERYYPAELVGFYGNVSTPSALISAIIPGLISPFVALYSRHRKKDDNLIIRGFWISIGTTLIIGLICIICVFIAGKPVMKLLYSDEIIPYVRWLYPIIITTTLYSMTYCANSVLISIRKNKQIAVFASLSVICCIIVAKNTIQPLGIKGVVITLAMSYIIQLIMQIGYIMVWDIKRKRE